MLALHIRYLNGWVAASDVGDRDRAEWPPHPGRVFMALAAAHFLEGSNSAEREALQWLEALEPPEIYHGGHHDRGVVTQYVPINDKSGPAKATLQSAPGVPRERQPRTFAHAWLENDTVAFVWPDAQPEARIMTALGSICSRVSRIGHSSSFVQVWLGTEAPEHDAPALVPNAQRAESTLRTTTPGTLAYLEERYNGDALRAYGDLKAEETAAHARNDQRKLREVRKELKDRFDKQPPVSLRPELSRWQGYAREAREISPPMSGTFFDPNLLVYRLTRKSGSYRALELLTTLKITRIFRKALYRSAAEQGRQLPESIIGHQADGKPSEVPHVAFVPLPFVGSEHADGKLMGIGLALPREFPSEERATLLAALRDVPELRLGPLGVWKLETLTEDRPPFNLLPEAWNGGDNGATEWSTVTPIVLDRHAKAKDPAVYREEVAEIIKSSCERVTEEKPSQVIVTRVSAHLGTPPAHAFPRLQRKDGSEMRHTHAIVIFDRPIAGPLFVGAGRYRGYGFCRPIL